MQIYHYIFSYANTKTSNFIKTALFLYAYRFIVRKDKVSLIIRFFYVFLH